VIDPSPTGRSAEVHIRLPPFAIEQAAPLSRPLTVVTKRGSTRRRNAASYDAAGLARKASGFAFPLIGLAPAGEIPPRGTTPVDPNHSYIVAVDNPAAAAGDAWGSETGVPDGA